MVIDFVSQTLATFGYDYEFITNPNFLFPILESKPFDLILLNVHLPNSGGVALLESLKQHEVYSDIPVIMLTSDTDQALFARCFDLGADDFLNKPVDPVILKTRLKATLANRAYIQEIQTQKALLEASNLELKELIQKQKATEEELFTSQKHLMTILDFLDDAVISSQQVFPNWQQSPVAQKGPQTDGILGNKPQKVQLQVTSQVQKTFQGQPLIEANLIVMDEDEKQGYVFSFNQQPLNTKSSLLPVPESSFEQDDHDHLQQLETLLMGLPSLLSQNNQYLLEESQIWSAHLDKAGVFRTTTLNRYLKLKTLPKKPRWRDVLQTGYFVMRKCPFPSDQRDLLAQELSVLEKVLR